MVPLSSSNALKAGTSRHADLKNAVHLKSLTAATGGGGPPYFDSSWLAAPAFPLRAERAVRRMLSAAAVKPRVFERSFCYERGDYGVRRC